jgi:hypothetical protein
MGTVEFLLSAIRQVYLARTLLTGVHHSCTHLNVACSLCASFYVHQYTAYGPR